MGNQPETEMKLQETLAELNTLNRQLMHWLSDKDALARAAEGKTPLERFVELLDRARTLTTLRNAQTQAESERLVEAQFYIYYVQLLSRAADQLARRANQLANHEMARLASPWRTKAQGAEQALRVAGMSVPDMPATRDRAMAAAEEAFRNAGGDLLNTSASSNEGAPETVG